jgi:hypothetical protein
MVPALADKLPQEGPKNPPISPSSSRTLPVRPALPAKVVSLYVDLCFQNGYKRETTTGEPSAMFDFEKNPALAARFALLFVLVAISMTVFGMPAWADSSSDTVFSSVQSKTSDIFTNVRNILMVVGALGVLGLAASAFFGHFKWSWAVSLLGGLALVAFVSQVISYFGLTAPATP